MLTWLQKLLFDETKFERLGRFLIFLIGEAVRSGAIVSDDPTWKAFGAIIQAAALLIAAGEKTPSWVKEAELTPKKAASDLVAVVPKDKVDPASAPIVKGD